MFCFSSFYLNYALTDLQCFYNFSVHFKGWNESVNNIRIEKKILNVENMFKYELGVFMLKFKRDT